MELPKKKHLKRFQGLQPGSQGQNLALTVLCVPCSYLKSKGRMNGRACKPEDGLKSATSTGGFPPLTILASAPFCSSRNVAAEGEGSLMMSLVCHYQALGR